MEPTSPDPSDLLPHGGMPFLSSSETDIFLFPGCLNTTALDDLVRLGALSSYRYLDASPNPAFLGFRDRS